MPPKNPDPPDRPSRVAVATGILVLAAVLAYAGSLTGPFLFDDVSAIAENPALRSWRTAATVDQGGLTTSGRPLLSLSFALNHALGGASVRGYHLLNVVIHAIAGLVLFGVVRRTLLLPELAGRFRAAALPLALAIAGGWLLHPLQTQAVTYIVQRAESLMGLWYLLTVYAFIRYADADGRRGRWFVVAVVCCALGMATKEVMVTAPIMVVLFDRAFVSGSLAGALRRHGRLHASLASCWVILFLLALAAGTRGGTMALEAGRAWWAYPLTQFEAVARYLALSVWPEPLVFEYGTFWIGSAQQLLPAAALVVPLVVVTAWALWRHPRVGFFGAGVFGILAPTSLAPGTIQMIVEHRMYLPLAAVLAGGVLALHAAIGRSSRIPLALAALACALLTVRRNTDYRSAIAIWSDTVAKRPANALAHTNLGAALQAAGRVAEAIPHYERAQQLEPNAPENLNNLGEALRASGRAEAAVPWFERALGLRPDFPEAHNNLGVTLRGLGRLEPAIEHYRKAIALRPEYGEARSNLGSALLAAGRTHDAMAELERALQLQPSLVEAHSNLAVALRHAGQAERAIAHFRAALQLEPARPEIHFNLALLLLELGRTAEAREHYAKARRLKPDMPELPL